MNKAEAGKFVYERHMRRLGCTLLPKVFTPDGEILLSERLTMFDGIPYYETYWMVHRDGIDLGRSVRTEAFGSIQLDRINEAVADAIGFITLNIRNKRYG